MYYISCIFYDQDNNVETFASSIFNFVALFAKITMGFMQAAQMAEISIGIKYGGLTLEAQNQVSALDLKDK